MSERSTIKPGILVGLATRAQGGVSYDRQDISDQQEGKARIAEWKTIRVITDEAEYKRASEAQSRARSQIVNGCLRTPFGLICPEDHEAELDQRIIDARAIVQTFNASSVHTKIQLHVITGRIARNDIEAQKAITAEVRSLLDDMKSAVEAADPERIREAASKAREIGQMLDPALEGQVNKAVKNVRLVARRMVSRIEKAGETAEVAVKAVLRELSLDDLNGARARFLDLSPNEPNPVPAGDTLPVADVQRFGDLDDEGGLEGLLFADVPQVTPELDETETPNTPNTEAAA
jgi:hypothetical protein